MRPKFVGGWGVDFRKPMRPKEYTIDSIIYRVKDGGVSTWGFREEFGSL